MAPGLGAQRQQWATVAAAQGGSGAASFGLGWGDEGSVGKVGHADFAALPGALPSASTTRNAAAEAAAQPSAPTPPSEAKGSSSSSAGNSGSGGFWDLRRMQQQIQSLGLAGVTAYGLFNTLYYSCAFLFFWICVAKVPSGQGFAATARAFAGVMAMVWAGSQVTKAPRAAAALFLAPLVDRGMESLQRALRLKTRRAVFLVFVAACLSLAAAVFAVVVLAWS